LDSAGCKLKRGLSEEINYIDNFKRLKKGVSIWEDLGFGVHRKLFAVIFIAYLVCQLLVM
jgi:hypothetical protein